MSTVLEIAKKINSKWNAEVITPGNLIPECQRFSMGTLSADYSLYGGLPEGKLITFAGESGSCKSLCSVLAMAKYQQKHPDKTNIYVDAENTLVGQIDWFVKMTGLDISPDKFLRYDCSGKAAEEIFKDIVELQIEASDNIGMIIIDSAPMLLTKADMDNDIDKDNGQRASVAKPLGKFCKIMVQLLAKVGNPLIIINHTRVAGTTPQGAKIYTEPAGYALSFFPSIKVRFGNRKFTKGDNIDVSASMVDADVDGLCATFSITKSRMGTMKRNGAKIIFRYETGVDTLTDLNETITKANIAKRLSNVSWQLVIPGTDIPYKDDNGNDLQFKGKNNMFAYLRDHEDFRKMYEKAVSDYMNGSSENYSLLDDEEIQQLNKIERNVESNTDANEKQEIADSIKEDNEKASENANKESAMKSLEAIEV